MVHIDISGDNALLLSKNHNLESMGVFSGEDRDQNSGHRLRTALHIYTKNMLIYY